MIKVKPTIENTYLCTSRKLGLERETGFEPATDGLGSRCATTALLPLENG